MFLPAFAAATRGGGGDVILPSPKMTFMKLLVMKEISKEKK
jgi:hypothetical protein